MHILFIFNTELKAVTIFVQNNVMKVLDSAGPYGRELARLILSSRGATSDKLAFYPNMPPGASTYFFNLGALIPGISRSDSCTLFESETDYPQASPQRSVGADGLGNHIGKHIFRRRPGYTFWITFKQQKYVLPHQANTFDWEAQIVCTIAVILQIKRAWKFLNKSELL